MCLSGILRARELKLHARESVCTFVIVRQPEWKKIDTSCSGFLCASLRVRSDRSVVKLAEKGHYP